MVQSTEKVTNSKNENVSSTIKTNELVKVITDNGSFDSLGAEISQGLLFDMKSAELLGYINEGESDAQTIKEIERLVEQRDKYRQLYELRNEVGRIEDTDPYDFALLEMCLGSRTIPDTPETKEKAINAMHYLGYKYLCALTTARVDEYLEFDCRDRPEELSEITDLYAKFIDADSQNKLQLIGEILDYILADNLRKIPDVDKNGWEACLQVAVHLFRELSTIQHPTNESALRIERLIDNAHSITHNNGSILNHLENQSQRDIDTVTLLELEMPNNLNVIYNRASPFAREIYNETFGIHFDKVDGCEIGSEEYFNEIANSAVNLLLRTNTHGKTAVDPTVLGSDVISELVINLGHNAQPCIDEILSQVAPRLKEIFEKNYPLSDPEQHAKVALESWKETLQKTKELVNHKQKNKGQPL